MITLGVDALCSVAHGDAKKSGWWNNTINKNVPTKLCLVHSEVSEAMEGYRKNLMDDKLPDRKAVEVELADAVIRIADLAQYLELGLGGAIVAKLEYNRKREDHKPGNRAGVNGKKF